ncbi:hypothetical protein PP175_28935 (plasmid) [Aneurinibacillus sp. Ricciae_BoGa-3]|uniref:hypothetical protein n=1 Tax=Aneurinibacillus sp. Ricciae_BoGa-3 TaxID=3022697 RepID=UPI0023405368|nr:hypothetical protein [Aneurinibacillus sp. Ricciae_BoGa-3]WCK57217.1 hypothetical protein PP175_28935 [Aneurinibacillus sp. Ricciae_BoGa-3]
MRRIIGFPQSEIEKVTDILLTMDGDLGSLFNNVDDRKHVLEMAQRISTGIKKVRRIIEDE